MQSQYRMNYKLGTLIVLSCKYEKSWCILERLGSTCEQEFAKNRLSVLALHIKFDVDFDIEQVKTFLVGNTGCLHLQPFVHHQLLQNLNLLT